MLKSVSSITNAIGALNFKGTWNASTNTPTLASGVGTKGDYFVVGVAGTTTLDGISNWGVGDWAAYNGSVWQRVEGGADLNGVNLSVSGTTTLSNLTASTALALNASKEVVSVTNTGTGNNVLASSPSITSPTFATDTTHSYLATSAAVATDANKKLVSVANTGTGSNVLQTNALLLGVTDFGNVANGQIRAAPDAHTAGVGFMIHAHAAAGVNGNFYHSYDYNGTQIGSITQVNTTGVAYNVVSDYRLKNITGPVTDSGAFIDALKPCKGSWKADGLPFVGFLAHEFQAVSPGSVTGTKDAVNDEGKPVMQAMQASSAEVIANLVAEIQDLRKRLAAAGL